MISFLIKNPGKNKRNDIKMDDYKKKGAIKAPPLC